jgi:hypothetical protein
MKMNILSYHSCKKLTLAATGLLAGLGVFAAANPCSAQNAVAISGSFDCTYTKKEVSSIGAAAEAHILMLDVCRGKNTNTGSTDYMAGAALLNQEIVDMAQGNGPQTGYVTMTKGADSIRVSHEGQIATTLNADKTPNTTFKGTWTFVSGAGQYAGVAGSGTYSGKMVSQATYHVDWTGSYSLESPAAAK